MENRHCLEQRHEHEGLPRVRGELQVPNTWKRLVLSHSSKFPSSLQLNHGVKIWCCMYMTCQVLVYLRSTPWRTLSSQKKICMQCSLSIDLLWFSVFALACPDHHAAQICCSSYFSLWCFVFLYISKHLDSSTLILASYCSCWLYFLPVLVDFEKSVQLTRVHFL